ncbi:AAA family ATPase [Dactylosporangium sp. CA-139066]|uniref:AAA family ATPase n=1 Tax=Dactylosporangium sp. CA-139066 TaxID=3239930 RepID=UPI003D8A46FD
MADIDDLVVLTGGPGSGKTTLLRHLAAAGFPVADEGGRAIIRAGVREPALLGELWLRWGLRSYRWARALPAPGPVFFDHAIPCLPGYWLRLGRPVPAHVLRAAATRPYRRVVFVAPPWRAIYRTDAERRNGFEEAARTHAAIVEGYHGLPYELVELPRAPVAERARFILSRLRSSRGSGAFG